MRPKYTDYDFSYFFHRVGVSASWTLLQGMNMTSAYNMGSDQLATDPNAHRSDLHIRSRVANLWLMPLSYNLGLDAFFDPASPATGSGVGLVAIGSYDDMMLSANGPLVPTEFAAPYGPEGGITSGTFKTLSSQLGAAAELCLAGFYASGLATFGSGTQTATYTVSGQPQNLTSVSDKLELRIATGYKGETFFSTFSYLSEQPTYYLQAMTLTTIKETYAWVLGARL